MNKKCTLIVDVLNKLYPDAHCFLNYSNDYELLVAIILSRQSTDASVNKVTPLLFSKYPNVESLSLANLNDVQNIIHSIGLSKSKSEDIIFSSKDIVNKFDGKIPQKREDLMSLRGVGRKTCNVFMIEYLKIPQMPVDTHVERVTKRLGIVPTSFSVIKTEEKIKECFLKEYWIKLHHQFIMLGRNICKSINPKCNSCPLNSLCSYFKKNKN